jgi:predicted amidohydrolase YtcJ
MMSASRSEHPAGRGRRAARLALAAFALPCACVLACAPGGAGSAGAGARDAKAPPPADLVLTGGAVYTVDAARTWAQAVAIRDGRIAYVGDDAGAKDHVGTGTKIADLAGRMLLPGFQDAHVHPVSAGLSQQRCALFDLAPAAALVERVARCAREHPDWTWILGDGWLVDNFAPSGLPDKRLLDAVVADRPVALGSSDGHSLWVNSRALEIAGITAATPDPPGGRIDRYPGSREPSGSLQEGAVGLVTGKAPPPTEAELEAALRDAVVHLNGLGITAIQDAAVELEPGDANASLAAYHALDAAGGLSLRVVTALFLDPQAPVEGQVQRFVAARAEHTRGNLRANMVKVWEDGVLETETAALLEPYLDRRDGHRGELLHAPERLRQAVTRLDALGFQVHAHAIGDAAVRAVLDAVAAARATNGPRDARHQIAHLELVDPADLPRLRELGVVANFQPLWAVTDRYITELTLPRIGAARGRWLYPIGSVARSGAVLAFGSDWNVSSADPLPGIETAVTRLDPDGKTTEPLTPEERISLADAIAAYTIGSAYASFLDAETGSIEVGKRADLVVLDRDLFAIPPVEISEAEVVATLFGGEAVCGSLGTASGPAGPRAAKPCGAALP